VRSRKRHRQAGFTLIEVMVALTVGAVVLLGAHALLSQLGDSAERIAASAVALDREASADAVLRSAVADLEAVDDAEHRFQGSEQGARFLTWCPVPEGWVEPCDAMLGIIRVGDENVLALELGAAEPIALRRGFRAGTLRYLMGAEDGGVWLSEWTSAVAPPLAVGVVLDTDTLILRIGERG
jgi:prepilin-type N-terminal cleavage/methylation domain-containing protein